MVRCLSCNYKLAYPEKLAGKRVRCPSCRNRSRSALTSCRPAARSLPG
ncbi:MAG: hypothetical protein R2864_00475 [Syntrophotaleaceae bacterium]